MHIQVHRYCDGPVSSDVSGILGVRLDDKKDPASRILPHPQPHHHGSLLALEPLRRLSQRGRILTVSPSITDFAFYRIHAGSWWCPWPTYWGSYPSSSYSATPELQLRRRRRRNKFREARASHATW